MKTFFNQVIILQLFLLVSVQSAPIHKRFCPMFPTAAECPPEPDNECNDDNKCAELYPGEGLKCCKDGCDLRCVPPLSKPVNTTLSPTTVKPVTNEVSEVCYFFPLSCECPPYPDNECNNDNKCAELYPGLGYKCCYDGCNFVCGPSPNTNVKTTLSPTTVRPVTNAVSGTCPVYPTPDECPDEEDLYHECNDDNKCGELYPGQGLKCCKDGCGEISCVSPVVKPVNKTSSLSTVRPVTNVVSGTCPVYPPPDECPPEEDLNHECNNDNKCAELYPGQGLKCCKDGCGEISCVSPLAKLVF